MLSREFVLLPACFFSCFFSCFSFRFCCLFLSRSFLFHVSDIFFSCFCLRIRKTYLINAKSRPDFAGGISVWQHSGSQLIVNGTAILWISHYDKSGIIGLFMRQEGSIALIYWLNDGIKGEMPAGAC